jgi:hypothetical protein
MLNRHVAPHGKISTDMSACVYLSGSQLAITGQCIHPLGFGAANGLKCESVLKGF